jgi:hypothetical protein
MALINCIIENVCVVDEYASNIPYYMHASLVSDVGSVHMQTYNLLDVEVLQVMIIEMQVVLWITHNQMFICWGFFIINDNLQVDFESSQMLQCMSHL